MPLQKYRPLIPLCERPGGRPLRILQGGGVIIGARPRLQHVGSGVAVDLDGDGDVHAVEEHVDAIRPVNVQNEALTLKSPKGAGG